MGALPLLTIVAPPFWAGLADRLKARAKVLSMVLLGAAVGCSAFWQFKGSGVDSRLFFSTDSFARP